ncbi:right-handed parallel beta-helix repeat-containing protein [Deinococcus marmoris]|uniref:Parallel beta-helix repeat n=1 Tax=Deinococcus marmoris TaxID=249408 RepID=A0A1U7P0L1_9DEIO|nr:right-handed parallel beta-helix repeat-containing protein [Deinococcus marmoris]OLV17230.1 Parallel beta-helix repeat [Deinococcus marmoris]OLV18709.1 Parallel beta-helix repeat [Deinococcus marmoris]
MQINRRSSRVLSLSLLTAALLLTACGGTTPTAGPTAGFAQTQGTGELSQTAITGTIYRVPGPQFTTATDVTLYAINTGFKPGDQILFDAAQGPFEGFLYFPANNKGTATSPITIGSFNGRATLQVTDPNQSGIFLENVAGYDIGNLNIVGPGAGVSQKDGVIAYNTLSGNVRLNFLNFHDLNVSGFGSGGISVGGNNGFSGYTQVFIKDSITHDNRKAGIQVFGPAALPADTDYANRDIYIGNNKAYNNFGDAASTTSNTGSGILVGNAQRVTIERNVAHDNGKFNTAVGGPIGIWVYDTDRATIQFNESYNNRTNSTADGGGFDLDGGVTNSVMQYNYSHGNDGAGYLIAQYPGARALYRNTVRYNISQNDARKHGYGAIELYGEMRDIDIYNNTVFMDAVGAAEVPSALLITRPGTFQSGDGQNYDIGPISNVRVANNIFYSRNGARLLSVGGGNTGIVLRSNSYFADGPSRPASYFYGYGGNFGNGTNFYQGTAYASLAAFRNATGQEVGGVQGNPRLMNAGGGQTIGNAYQFQALAAYQLQSTSPIRNNGLNLASQFGINAGATDFYGVAIPAGSGFSRGASDM